MGVEATDVAPSTGIMPSIAEKRRLERKWRRGEGGGIMVKMTYSERTQFANDLSTGRTGELAYLKMAPLLDDLLLKDAIS